MTEYEKRLKRLLEEVLEELKNVEIHPAGTITSITENRRARKRLGCCRQEGTGLRRRYRLEVSIMLLDKDDRTIKEVIAHEALHTCKGCLNHGAEWKRLAAAVNHAYGYHIERTADYAGFGMEEKPEEIWKYRIRCRNCGNTGYRIKKSRVVTNPENYRCSKCGGALEVDQL